MKSKEEIEQLAKSKFSTNKNISLSQSNKTICRRSAFIKGYTQCQEDMANKKYTEEDIRKAITFGQGMELWKEEKQIEDFIKSLNKQD